jgi:hypothetical protein
MIHKVGALKHLPDDWDWLAVWHKPLSTGVRAGNSPIVPHWSPIVLYGIHTLGTKTAFTPDVFAHRPERGGHQNGLKGRESWASADVAGHPTPLPLSLCVELISAFGQSDGPVLDPFMGSGTTLRAAKDLGRRAIGIEIEERYCEIAAKRLGQQVLDFGAALVREDTP